MSVLDKFTVIELINTRSDSVVMIDGNVLKFNKVTAEEMFYTPFIQILINPKDKQFAIRSCKEDAPNAIAFSKPKEEQRYRVTVNSPVVTDAIRKMAGWNREEKWDVPAILVPEEDALIYDVKAAYTPVSKGGGWTAKKAKEASAAAEKAEATDTSNAGEETSEV